MTSLSRRSLLCLGALALLSACMGRAPSGSTSPAELSEAAITGAINGTRRANGQQPLSYSQTLERAARTHATLMASRDQLSHSLGGTLRQRVTAAGYDGAVGENLAGGQQTLEAAIQGWLNSPGHRSTLLSSRFTEFGLAAARTASGKTYWAFIAGGDFNAWR